jgi:hypothetical protein
MSYWLGLGDAMGSLAGGEQSAMQPPVRVQLAKMPVPAPDEEPEEDPEEDPDEEPDEDPDEEPDEDPDDEPDEDPEEDPDDEPDDDPEDEPEPELLPEPEPLADPPSDPVHPVCWQVPVPKSVESAPAAHAATYDTARQSGATSEKLGKRMVGVLRSGRIATIVPHCTARPRTGASKTLGRNGGRTTRALGRTGWNRNLRA